MARFPRRILFIGCAIVIFLVLVGATYQGVNTAIERRRFPHPGRLVDVGGHQLHLNCTGEGDPTVLLEAPAVAMSAVWAWVQESAAQTTRVCSYDRAGLGWSELGDAPLTPTGVADELITLVRRAGERGPFVVAGAGLGASFAQLLASKYPDDTAALLLVNAPAPGSTPDDIAPHSRLLTASPWLARAGLLRAVGAYSEAVAALPPSAAGALAAFLNRPDHLTRAASEVAYWDEIVSEASTAPLRQDLPVTQLILETSTALSMLTTRDNADAVADAIVRAVVRVRSRQTGEHAN